MSTSNVSILPTSSPTPSIIVATLTCRYCPTTFDSVLVIPERAIEEVTKGLIDHLQKKHPAEAKTILEGAKQIAALAIWLLTVGPHTTMLDEEDEEKLETNAVYQQFDLQLEQIHDLIGVEDSDDEEDEDNEEEGDMSEDTELSDEEGDETDKELGHL